MESRRRRFQGHMLAVGLPAGCPRSNREGCGGETPETRGGNKPGWVVCSRQVRRTGQSRAPKALILAQVSRVWYPPPAVGWGFIPCVICAPAKCSSPCSRHWGATSAVEIRSGRVTQRETFACEFGREREWRNGRRVPFRAGWGDPWGFNSPLSHQTFGSAAEGT